MNINDRVSDVAAIIQGSELWYGTVLAIKDDMVLIKYSDNSEGWRHKSSLNLIDNLNQSDILEALLKEVNRVVDLHEAGYLRDIETVEITFVNLVEKIRSTIDSANKARDFINPR